MRVYVGGLNYRVNEKDVDVFFKNYSGVGEIMMKNGFAFVEFDERREGEDAIYEMNGRELMGGRVTVEKATGTPRPSRRDGSYNGDRDRDRRDNDRDRGSYGSRDSGRDGGGYNRDRGSRDYGRSRGGEGARGGRSFNGGSRFPTRTNFRLNVSNLSTQVSWQDLKDFMRQAGEVTYADAHKVHQNEGVIEFATKSDMKAALDKLDGRDLHGRRIKLTPESKDYDDASPPRRGGGRRSWSSHSRSRSPRSRSPVARGRDRSRSASPPRKQKESRQRSFSPYENHKRAQRRSTESRSRSRD